MSEAKSISNSNSNTKKKNWISAVIIDDDDEIETPNENVVMPTLANNETEVETIVKVENKEKKERKPR